MCLHRRRGEGTNALRVHFDRRIHDVRTTASETHSAFYLAGSESLVSRAWKMELLI